MEKKSLIFAEWLRESELCPGKWSNLWQALVVPGCRCGGGDSEGDGSGDAGAVGAVGTDGIWIDLLDTG